MDTEYDAPMEVEANDIAAEPDGPTEVDVETQPVEQPNILDIDQYADYHVQVGEDSVSLQELRNSGLRQADYTRKTQELAERGRDLDRAATLDRMLEVNPRGTLEYLAHQNGLSIADIQSAAQSQPNSQDWLDESEPTADPMAQRLAAIEERFLQEDTNAEYRHAFDGLKSKFGESFDQQEVARAAYERGIYDPNHMEMVANDLAFRKLQAAVIEAQRNQTDNRSKDDASRRQAAAAAGAVTGGGASASGTTAIPPQTKPLTTREAIEMAWESSQ